MATIQQLDRLHSIKRNFLEENTLESAVLCQRIDKIIYRTEQMLQQRAFLREERRKLRSASEYLEGANRSVALIKRGDWLPFPEAVPVPKPKPPAAAEEDGTTDGKPPPAASSSSSSARINKSAVETRRINMSGLMFEVPAEILKRDPGSLLASLDKAAASANATGDPGALVREEDGVIYLERDWWLFRYVLAFLRDGSLPNETSLLIALYREGGVYGCGQLQYAIEEKKLHLREPDEKEGVDKKEGGAQDPSFKKDKGTPPWWKSLPSWYQAVDAVKEAAKENEARASDAKASDWWLGTSYKGKNFQMKK